MNVRELYKSREWGIVRRLLLVLLVLIVVYRLYGDRVAGWLQHPNATRDLAITRAEFRTDIPGSKPSWIIGFKNGSRRFAYDRIQLDATYTNSSGDVIQRDKLLVHHRILPGEETIIGSPDFRERPGAVAGDLKLIQADAVK